jgi:hypothetical protein
MGYSISWLAVRDTPEESVLAALGLEKTGEAEEGPKSRWCSKRVNQWTVAWSNSFQPWRFRNAASKFTGEVVVFAVEEHVMFASAAAFSDGRLRWRVAHDEQEARDHLAVEGNPPQSLKHIQAEQLARMPEDPEVNFVIEIPVRLAQEVVGFRYEEGSEGVFDVLRVSSGTRPKWKFW